MSYDKAATRMGYVFTVVDFGTGSNTTETIGVPTDGTQD